ncbi:DUF2381 family protein [Pyxidicoccus parkwayensis]|uniref:DUF2381 family protein n=1 Tax=Pyxidicoccus parkwayensis TaxID=2813578 RepID=A0ABX7NZG3_9BACT|nr:DUF2381 family protein [Pyxidicoccus parkwaysis]QSQ23796.1 DUF2381 family protein [Pyxidicoccus parkwaysis]
MSLPVSWVMAWLVLMGAAAPGQPHESGRQKTERVIILRGDEELASHVLRVAPEAATLVLFDMPLLREAVDLGPLKSFERAEVTERSLVLRPAVALPLDAPQRLTVRFADGRLPRQLELTLTSAPDVVDTQVEVRRVVEPEARLAAELTKLRGLCAATEAGLAPLRARCARAGLAGLFVSGEMDREKGVRAFSSQMRPTELGVEQKDFATVFRTGDTVMVGLRLENPSGGAPWVAGPARLVRLGERGQPLEDARRVPVFMEPERLAPGESAWVALQWEEPPGAPAAAVRLEVADESGRGLRWERLELRLPIVAVPRPPRGGKDAP